MVRIPSSMFRSRVDQPSTAMQDPEKVLQSQEKKKKKRKYLKAYQQQQCRAFTSFVTSVDRLLDFKARNVAKQLACRLARIWQKPYSMVCGIVCSCISIVCVCTSHFQYICCTHVPVKKTSPQIQWEVGACVGQACIALCNHDQWVYSTLPCQRQAFNQAYDQLVVVQQNCYCTVTNLNTNFSTKPSSQPILIQPSYHQPLLSCLQNHIKEYFPNRPIVKCE